MNRSVDAVASPEVIETHISTVFFVGDRAFKLLKPIRTSFLDHTAVDVRLRAVDQELEMNRRLAPDVYLGTADVVENGVVSDRMLVMRRLPADRRLSNLVGCDDFAKGLAAVARRMTVFHAAHPPLARARAEAIAGCEAVRRNWHDNLIDLRAVPADVLANAEIDEVADLVDRYLDGRAALFDARIDGGFIRDGHGDLRAEDIFCTPEGPQILDCLAFDPLLRIADVLADIAFLAMDAEMLDGPAAAKAFVDTYCRLSNEHHPSSLAHHYIAYRAHVRAKVAAIRLGQGGADVASEIVRYHDLCLRHLRAAEPTLILVGGSPGTGKSTLARSLSARCGAMVLSTDELRKDLAEVGHEDRHFEPLGEGLYAPAMTERTYVELLHRAETLLANGESVILDGSWSRQELRDRAAAVASAAQARLIEVECVLEMEKAMERVGQRLARGDDASDARPEMLDQFRAQQEPWPTAVKVDTSGPAPGTVEQVLRLLTNLGTS